MHIVSIRFSPLQSRSWEKPHDGRLCSDIVISLNTPRFCLPPLASVPLASVFRSLAQGARERPSAECAHYSMSATSFHCRSKWVRRGPNGSLTSGSLIAELRWLGGPICRRCRLEHDETRTRSTYLFSGVGRRAATGTMQARDNAVPFAFLLGYCFLGRCAYPVVAVCYSNVSAAVTRSVCIMPLPNWPWGGSKGFVSRLLLCGNAGGRLICRGDINAKAAAGARN